MLNNFEKALKFTLKYEGGYVNHPADPGGATNKGVTQVTYNNYRKQKALPNQDVRRITDDEVRDIYKNLYWDKINGDDLPSGLDIALFDFGVNSGVSRANKFLAEHPGASADVLNDYREAFFKSIGKGSKSVFLRGWLNRLNALRVYLKSI